MEPLSPKQFDWVEYSVFGAMLAASGLIGVYFGWIKGGQNSVSEYLLGNKQMSIFPITMSLVASQISTFTLLGIPTEIYTFGAQFSLTVLANIGAGYITLAIFLPVFYKLQLISLFEYLELRFSYAVRVVTSILYMLSLLTFLPIVMYGPALALNQVSGLNIHIITAILVPVCIFYTTLGGLKAVVWTDTLQGIIMIFSVVTVMFLGILKAGGIISIFEAANAGDRLNIFDMNPDPTRRLSFWTVTIGLTITWAGYIAVHPGSVQRFIALPTYRQARKSVFYLVVGQNCFAIPSIFIGLIMYTVYKDCDPLTAKVITRSDQILPYFVLDVAGHIKGLPGLFIVGLCSASLSTLSTGLNSLAGTVYEDFIQPCLPAKLPDEKASLIMKSIVVALGVVCLVLVILFEKLGSILELTASFGGVTIGSMMGIFALGILFPMANNKGAIIGGLASIVITTWLMIGNQLATLRGDIYYPTKPKSVEGCMLNVTFVPHEPHENPDDVWFPYRISLFYYGLIGTMSAIVVGVIASCLTGPLKFGDVHPDLVHPTLRKYFPKDYSTVPLRDVSPGADTRM